MATITFQNANGGSWHNAANWNPQQVPGINDDAIIPAFVGNPVIQIDSSASARTITSDEAINVNGGTLTFTQINQLAGNFTLNTATLAGGTFTSGALIIPSTGSAISGLTIAPNATLRLAANARTTLSAVQTLTINGGATLESASTLTLATSFNQTTSIVVNGTLSLLASNGQGATITSTGNGFSTVVTNGGGRLSSSFATFQISEVNWDYGAFIGASDLQSNRFDAGLLIPPESVRMLSAQGGGSDNRRFGLIRLRGGVYSAGTLTLAAIGTET